MMANIICLIINLLTNFLVPKYVSIESYGMIKTYALYLTYAGFLVWDTMMECILNMEVRN